MDGEIVEKIFNAYGVFGVMALAFFLVASGVFIKYITNLILNTSWFKFNFTVDPMLRDHLFFTNAKYKLRLDIPTLELAPDKPVKQQVYRDLLYLNIEAYYYGCKRVVETTDFRSLSGAEWGNVLKNELHLMFKSYENKAEDFGVPPIILQKYIKWHNTFSELLINYIDQLSNSKIYGDSVLRTAVFLLIMNLLLITIIGDLDKLVRSDTDDTTGVIYRGSPLED